MTYSFLQIACIEGNMLVYIAWNVRNWWRSRNFTLVSSEHFVFGRNEVLGT